MLKVQIIFKRRVDQLDTQPTRRAITAINAQFPKLMGRVNVMITSAAEVKQLNRQYAGLDMPTDVLSFNYREQIAPGGEREQIAPGGEREQVVLREQEVSEPALKEAKSILGEIVISREHLSIQAKKAKISEVQELARLVVHGVLHLLGHDHQTLIDKHRFDSLATRILTHVGSATLGS